MELIKKYKDKQNIILFMTNSLARQDYKKKWEQYTKCKDFFIMRNTIMITGLHPSKSNFDILFIDMDQCKKIITNQSINHIKQYVNSLYYIKENKLSIVPKDDSKYGYKNKQKALQTIQLLKTKPIFEKLNTINRLTKRALYHPYRTSHMLESVRIFNSEKKKLKDSYQFEYLSPLVVQHFIPLAQFYNIGLISRGIIKPKITKKRFLDVYKKKQDIDKLKYITISDYSNTTWETFRHRIIFKKIQSINNWFTSDGIPTEDHVILILWAYSPFPAELTSLIKTKKIEKFII